MANTILEKLQEKYPGVTDDARNIAEAIGMINGTGGRGSGAIADVMNSYLSVIFDPNEGTGDALVYTVPNGIVGFKLPECPFTPPEGKTFDYWRWNSSEPTESESKKYHPGKTTNIMIVQPNPTSVTFYAIWKDAE